MHPSDVHFIDSGDFKFDFHNGRATSSVARNGFLDPEIASEGLKAVDKIILSDGEQVAWAPPQAKPVIPDWSQNKSIAHYFGRVGYQTWPCWFYHPTEKEVLIKDAKEAFERFGIQRRKATDRERAQFGAGEWVWDTPDGCLWQSQPYPKNVPGKFDPNIGAQGKNYVPRAPDPQIAQHALIEQLVTAMQGGQNQFLGQLIAAMGGRPPAAPGAAGVPEGIDAADWKEFQEFQEFKRQRACIPVSTMDGRPAEPDGEKAEWIAKAEECGIKIDRRWSAEKIRNHVMTELERRLAEAENANVALSDSIAALANE